MSFVPRSQQDIFSGLLAFSVSDPDVAAGIAPTDLLVGSVERAHLESIALLMEESEQRVAQAIVAAIPDACFRMFGFDYLPAQKAVTGIIFSCFIAPTADIPIPTGYQLLGPSGTVFQVTADGVISAGSLSSAAVPIQCVVAGVVGNVPADTITKLVSPIAGIDFLTNPSAAIGGADIETTDARALRFAAFLQTLPRGTKEALEFAAMSANAAVTDARAVEPFLLDPRPSGVPYSGLVWLFVDDGTDNIGLNTGVLSEITNMVEGYVDPLGLPVPGFKAAGTHVEILKVGRVQVKVRAVVTLRPGGVSRWAAIQTTLTATALNYFGQLRVGQKASYQSLVTALSVCDPDIGEVDLAFWPETQAPPLYLDPLSAEDITFYDPTQPYSIGSRGVLFSGAAPGPDGPNVTYPEWRLG